MSGAKDRPHSSDVQSDQAAYDIGWERVFGKHKSPTKPTKEEHSHVFKKTSYYGDYKCECGEELK